MLREDGRVVLKDRVKTAKRRALVSFLVGSLIGAVIFLLQYGTDVLDFTNVKWLTHSNDLEGLWDLSQHYFGWVAYRKSQWSFPIGLLDGITAGPISVAYTDSIPLFAVFFKVLSPLLPADFQYFGLFELITYILMGGFGSLCTSKYSKSFLVDGFSAVLFVVSPVLLKRTFYHTALSAHFLILAAICLWIYKDSLSAKKRIILWSILCVISTLINPYYVPMVMGILLCSLLQEFILVRKWIYTIISVIIPGISTLFVGWIIGLFYGEVSSGGKGLEMVSFNLNQLINPNNPLLRHSDYQFDYVSYSKLLRPLSLHTDWQMEGFSYLGIGCILLCILVAVLWVRDLIVRRKLFASKTYRRKYISYIIAVAVGVVVFTLLALGPDASFGTHVIYSIKWPDAIYNLFAMFRTCGRFIWPVYYGIMTVALIGINALIDKKLLITIIVGACTLIQIIDLWPSFVYKHEVYKSAYNSNESSYINPLYTSDTWNGLKDRIDEIVFVPPTENTICFLAEKSCMFEQYAIENDIQMNASYCSRDVSAMADKYASSKLSAEKNNNNDGKAVYVMLYDYMIPVVKDAGLSVYKYNDIYIAYDVDLSMYKELELVK